MCTIVDMSDPTSTEANDREATWVSPADWADDHDVTRQTVHNLISEGLFDPVDVMKIGRATRVRRDAVPRRRERLAS
jgi:predicted nucleic acid-binding Zn ribbon protein